MCVLDVVTALGHTPDLVSPRVGLEVHIPAQRVGVNSGIESELSSIPNPIPEIVLGIGIEKKELELTKMPRINKGIYFF